MKRKLTPKRAKQTKLPTLMCVAPFNNPHIVPFYEKVRESEKFTTSLVNLQPISEARKQLGWLEMPPETHWIQPWRSFRDRCLFIWKLLTVDLVVFPGFFHTKSLPLFHMLRRLRQGKTILWSEPFLNHPNVIGESNIKKFVRRAMLKPINSNKYYFLAMGAEAERDYQKIGMDNWNYYQFLFTVDTDTTAKSYVKTVNKTKRIVFCGSLTHRKGVDILIRALGGIMTLDYELTIIGGGTEQTNLETLAKQLGISDHIKFVGNHPADQINQLLKNQDILVLPSRFDGWGAVINEAMACSLAVIASNKVGSRKPLIKHGINGYIFKSESPEDLREKLLKVLTNEDELAMFQLESRRRALQFSPASVSSKFLDFCETITKNDQYSSDNEILANLNGSI